MYFAYLDEFGHVGPFAGRSAVRFNESPVFGLAGMLIPASAVRDFSTWFYQLKTHLLKWEIEQSGLPPYSWEKKGAQLFTTRNVERYPEVRRAMNRILNKVADIGGEIVYVGLEKYASPEDHNAKALYLAVLKECIKRIDQFCQRQDAQWLLLMDEQERSQFRQQIVSVASIAMFGAEGRTRLVEPPIQAESHLFQTLQCADWICGLIGRHAAHHCRPEDFAEFGWARKYFQARLETAAPFSGLRRRADATPAS